MRRLWLIAGSSLLPLLPAIVLGIGGSAEAAPGVNRPEWILWGALGAVLLLLALIVIGVQGGRGGKRGRKITPPYF